MPLLRDGTTTQDRRLDRLYEGDIRNRLFSVTDRLSPTKHTKPKTKQWPVNLNLDQGPDGACVGFGFAHELAAEPVVIAGVTNTYAKQSLYWGTQRIDPWPGGAYPGADPFYEGTSVLSGAKYVTSLGYYTGYHWAFNEPDLALALSYLGPVVLGINWHQAMFTPDKFGYLRATGPVVGGHCLLISGYSAARKFYTLHNSWGASWGDHGTAKVSAATMAKLLADNGDACVPVGRQLNTIS
jgi:hypothetical protein